VAEHPAYPNPTIAEAVCEVHFTLAPDAAWSPSNPGQFWKEIASDYPDIEPIIEAGIGFKLNEHGGIEQILTERKRYRFTNPSKTMMIHIAENIFTLNVLPPWPGSDAMRDQLIKRWSIVRRLFNPQNITRVGVRYINKMPRLASDELASYWLRDTDFIAKAPLNSEPPFLSRVEARINDKDRAVVNVGILKNNSPYGVVLFDIDCIRQYDTSTDDEALASCSYDLGEIAWQIFCAGGLHPTNAGMS